MVTLVVSSEDTEDPVSDIVHVLREIGTVSRKHCEHWKNRGGTLGMDRVPQRPAPALTLKTAAYAQVTSTHTSPVTWGR